VCTASAMERATPEQIRARASTLSYVWDAPASNYNVICSSFIMPAALSREELLHRLKSALQIASSSYEQSAINYLIGETYYWGSGTAFQKSRNKQDLLGVGDQVASSFLTAWDSIRYAETNGTTVQLRHTIVKRFNELLETSVCGAGLSTNRKQEVVIRYINQLNEDDKSLSEWSFARQNKVYSNLNMQCRSLADVLPVQPQNFTNVWGAMKLAISINATNEALQRAILLEDVYRSELAKSVPARRDVCNVYMKCSDARALDRLHALVSECQDYWLDIYDISIAQNKNTSQDIRNKYIEHYLSFSDIDMPANAHRLRKALVRLEKNGDTALAIQWADKFLHLEGGRNIDLQEAHLWRLKAIAHVRREEWALARMAYQESIMRVPTQRSETILRKFRRDLASLEKQMEAKGIK
jgi:hypothetical protein